MGLVELFLIAMGLSMDAFAVAITLGLSMQKVTLKKCLIIGLYFGIFQGGMPLLGYLLGAQFIDYIQVFDHWIAFVLLGVIGGKMIWESLKKDEAVEVSGADSVAELDAVGVSGAAAGASADAGEVSGNVATAKTAGASADACVGASVSAGYEAQNVENRTSSTKSKEASLGPKKMLPLAIATSIDALAVGISFALMDVNIIFAVLSIALVTLTLSMVAVKIGNVFGARYKARAELVGGIILVLIGLKILLEHLGVISF